MRQASMAGAPILQRLGTRQRVLLLQGPMGPFFEHLAVFLQEHGKQVLKVNFNAGDEWFYRQPNAIAFKGAPSEWTGFFEQLLIQHRIDAVVLFGDCRGYHRSAVVRAKLRGVEVFVFEEGYVRPSYVTFERGGVNAFSAAMHVALDNARPPPAEHKKFSNPFAKMAWFSAQYYLQARLGRKRFELYRHHKPFDLYPEAWYWLRAGLRKQWYRFSESGIGQRLVHEKRKQFFLVPLQVFNDSQVREHSDYRSVRDFIADVMRSFARSAPADVLLVIKQHPMDRGHKNYRQQIAHLTQALGLGERVLYIHDQYLPSLLKAALGTVVINSTVGLSSLFHGTPVKTMGRAIYALPGLAFEGDLDAFWHQPKAPAKALVQQFRNCLVQRTQVAGSFYSGKRLALHEPASVIPAPPAKAGTPGAAPRNPGPAASQLPGQKPAGSERGVIPEPAHDLEKNQN